MRTLDSGMNRPSLRLGQLLFVAIVIVLMVTVIGWFMGSSNPYTPAGYVGYVYQKALFGKAQFLGTQSGPTSWGRTWMADVVNVSITPYTYDEEFIGKDAVLAKDDLKIEFRVHVLFQIDDTQIQPFVEHFTTMQATDSPDKVVEVAYDNYLKEPLRTYSRAEVQTHDGLQIKTSIEEIGARISDKMLALAKGTPFKIRAIVVGNIQYPEAVADAVAEKLAATQILERKQTEIEIKKADARGIAEAMKTINDQLTYQYLQYLAIEGQKMMINSPNHTVIYIPVGPMGVPLVGTFDAAAGKPAATGGK